MKNSRFKRLALGCAAAFSFAAAPAFCQAAEAEPAPAPAEAPKAPKAKTPEDAQYEFLVKRVVRFNGGVDRDSVTKTIQQLTQLEDLDPTRDVTLIINSPGGSVVQGLALIDRIQSMRAKVNTVCLGEAQSMGAVLLAAGTGTRSANADCVIMIHQASNTIGGKVPELESDLNHTAMLNDRLIEILSRSTGLSQKDLRYAMLSDFRVTPDEAKSMGLIDTVIPVVNARLERSSRTLPPAALTRNFPAGVPVRRNP